jgi:orotate phosphoribosyltransferase
MYFMIYVYVPAIMQYTKRLINKIKKKNTNTNNVHVLKKRHKVIAVFEDCTGTGLSVFVAPDYQ